MSTALRLDTLSFSKRLRNAGADEALAEAIVEGITGADTSELATKADLREVESALKADIADTKAELKSEIADVRTELKQDIADVRTDIAGLKYDVKWIKIIGGAILVILILPMIAEAIG